MFSRLTVWENLLLGAFGKAARRETARNLELALDAFPMLQERRQLAGTLSAASSRCWRLPAH